MVAVITIGKEIYFCSRFTGLQKLFMSSQAKTIQHIGKVQEVTLNTVKVTIQAEVSCAGCQAQAVCGAAESGGKFVVVSKPNHNYLVGQTVRLTMLQSLGFLALFWAYIAPFVIVLMALIVFSALGLNELYAGVLSLSLLIPYFLALYLFKGSISSKISFDIQKI